MEEYPEEIRSPPVSLVAAAGCADLHQAVTSHLHSLQPPINSLALPSLSDVYLLISPKRNPSDDQSSLPAPAPPVPAGILKHDWLLKHRTRIPAVVAAFFSSSAVSGDPAQWLQLCSDLDNLKSVIRARNVRLVVVVVHSHSKDDITEDRMLALRKRAEIDPKYFVTFSQNDENEMKQSLHRLGGIYAELASTYYRDEGRRIKSKIEKKTYGSVELYVRYCFKVAVYAEFRRDWAEALKFYEEAYHTLREMIGKSTRLPPIQRLIEIKSIAEQMHFKISTLLLHGGKITEAVTWFRQHHASYRRLIGASEAVFLHWEWMSRQFLVFAELLEASSATLQNISSLTVVSAEKSLTEWEFRPAYYYQLAAHYLKEKRSALEIAVSISETFNETNSSAESVAPSTYVGQFARLIEQGDALVMQLLTDEEYIQYAIAEGKRFQNSFETIALLKKSYESFSNLKVQRIAAFCAFQMAREYYGVGDFSNAKQLFDGIATLYRQEGWVALLWDVLGYLRECSRKQGAVKDFIEYSLEMAALPVSSDNGSGSRKESGPAGPANLTQKEVIQREVFGLIGGESLLTGSENNTDLKVTEDNPLRFEIDLVSPLRVVLLASVAFHEQIVKPGSSTPITLSLRSQLPLTLEVDQLEVQFNQSVCNLIVVNSQRSSSGAVIDGQDSHQVQNAPSLIISSNKWLRLTFDIKSDQSGKLECISVVAKIGPHFTVCCRAESPASMGDLPLWKFEDRVETYPTKDPALAFTGQKAIQVEEPDPQVDLNLGTSGPAFVGESFVVPVTVASKGHDVHSGELKINLVDVRGSGLFSPRESDTLSMDDAHVELLGISGSEGEDEPNQGIDKIKKIKESFGLVSVPFLKCGQSWSCKLEIKWHRPKPVMLYVSLGYSPDNSDSTAHKVNIHKSLQIEGKTAIIISHRFMLPFRRDPLLLSRIKPVPDSDQLTTLPMNETSILIVSAKNCSEVPLWLTSISIEADGDDIGMSCSVQHGGDHLDPAIVVPGEEFKKVFSVTPKMDVSKLKLGNVCVTWKRGSGVEVQSDSTASLVLTKQALPDVNLELSPLVVSLECPPYAILGDPFTFFIKIQNQTQLLQEIKLSLADATSFVMSGSHNDTIYVLPKSENILAYKLVPLASGTQQLPRFTLTSVRYSTAFQPSNVASTLFVFPSKPHFKTTDVGDKRIEPLAAE